MSRIANPVFNGSPTDNLTAADIYGEVSDTVRNSFTTQFSAFGQSLQENLGQVRGSLTKIGQQLLDGSLTVDDAKARLKSSLRGARGDLDNLREGITESIIDGMGGNELKVAMESGYQSFRGADLDSAKGVMSLMRDLTGNQVFDIVDVGAQVGLFRGVLEEVSAWGVPELVDSVLTEVDDPKMRREVVQYSTNSLAQGSDIDSLEMILNQVDASALTANRPDFPKQVLQRYTFKKGTTPADYPERLSQLVGVMNRLQFDWFWTRRNGENVWNLGIISSASDDARRLFYSDPEYRTPALIAEQYPEKDTRSLMRSMYPGIGLV